MSTLRVREATFHDRHAYVAHLDRHTRESGREGSPHFAVRRDFTHVDPETMLTEHWARDVREIGWRRSWMLADEETGVVRGHAALEGAWVEAALHRSLFSIGIERAHVGRGWGGALASAALTFARAWPTLSWIDLRVFAQNRPARRLYDKLGFVAVGEVKQAFVMWDGSYVDDIAMVLALR